MTDYRVMKDSNSPTTNSTTTTTFVRDPFDVVKEKVQDLAIKLREEFSRWKELLETTSTSNNKEFVSVSQSMKVAIKKLNTDLNDLDKTTKIVSDNRLRFKHITDSELDSRKKFVNDMKALVQECQDTLDSDRTKRKINKDQRDADHSSAISSGLSREFQRQGDEFVENKQQEQAMLEGKQDLVLDDMSAALHRLGDVSSTIGSELVLQKEMLIEMDNEMDETQDRMNIVMKKTQQNAWRFGQR